MKRKNNKYVNEFVFSIILIALSYFISRNTRNTGYEEGMAGAMIFLFGLSGLIIWGLIAWISSTSKKSKNKNKFLLKDKKIKKEKSINNDLGASLKRLKNMYNHGNLTKAEFEKAKNKLLK